MCTTSGFGVYPRISPAVIMLVEHEESGITVTNARYFGSQPWPLGDSSMVGFQCRALIDDFVARHAG